MRRRPFLSTIGSTVLIAGCMGSPSDGTTEGDSSQTTIATETATERDCTVPESSPLPSTEVPSELTRETAKSAAISVEETYPFARAESDGWKVDGTDGTRSTVQTSENGFFILATVNIDTHKSTDGGTGTEQTLYGSFSYEGWYRINEKRIERAPAYSGDTPPEEGWKTVACA